MQQQKNDKTTCLLLALTTIFWGSLYTASKVLLDVIQPFTLLCLRYIIAAIAMTILQRTRKPDPNGKPRRIKGGDWKFVIMFGLGGYVLSIGLQQYGTKLAGASLASLINCMNPIAICFFAVLLLHDVFGYGYDEVAGIVGKSEANSRQLATRARRHLEERRRRFDATREEQRELAEVDLLLDDVARPLDPVHLLVDHELERRLEGRRVGHVALDALLDGVLGVGELGLGEGELHGLLEVANRGNLFKDLSQTGLCGNRGVTSSLRSFQTLRPALVTHEAVEAIGLDSKQVGNLQRFVNLRE